MEFTCPHCGGKTVSHGFYDRKVKIEDTTSELNIFRVKCNDCRRTHAILPDFICPRKHYSACDIELAVSEIEEGIAILAVETEASPSTVRRWWNSFRLNSVQALGALKSIMYRLFEKVRGELIFSNLSRLKCLEKILDEFPRIHSSNLIIGEANIWISNNMVGIYI